MLRPNGAPVGWLPMTHHRITVRSGLTAIAAVLALSSTPLLAQETTPPPDPVTETSSEPAPTADPLAPEPTASQPEATEPAPEEASPAPAPTRRTAARSRTAATNRASSEPVRTAAPAPAPQPAEATAETMPVPPPAAAPVTDPFAPAEPVAVEEPVADETLPIAGAAGLGLLALGAIGLAVQGRRRRREERAHQLANQKYLDEHPAESATDAHEPAFAKAGPTAMAAAAPGAALTDAPKTKLPKDFDLSRFGPHVQAAYRGPTEDNPSLSLRHRLRRAAAMDQKARQEGTTRQPPARPATRPKPTLEPMWAANGDGFMLRRAASRRQPQPAFQK